MQTFCNKQLRVQLPQDLFSTPTWLLFFILEHQYTCHDVMLKHSANQFIDQASRTDVDSHNITLLNRPLGQFGITVVRTIVTISYYIEREDTNLL